MKTVPQRQMTMHNKQATMVVCGESLLDVFENGRTTTGLQLDAVVGGSPLNVAMGLARLGSAVAFLGGISGDFLGARIQQTLQEEGISPEALVLCDAPTTLSLIGLDAQGVPSYRFYGTGGADRQVRPEHLERVPQQVDAFHFGSYACVVEPIASAIKALVQARQAGSVISYDPNVRLNVESNLQVWRDMIDWMSPRTHLLKLSDEDFERLYPDQSPEQLAQRWLADGVRLVMLTRGGQGASAWTAAGRIDVQAPQVQVADTVGAGDTFQAATLVALAELGKLSPAAMASLTLDEVARIAAFAAHAAAITCTRRGPDLPRRAELAAEI
jgi:fructokinase